MQFPVSIRARYYTYIYIYMKKFKVHLHCPFGMAYTYTWVLYKYIQVSPSQIHTHGQSQVRSTNTGHSLCSAHKMLLQILCPGQLKLVRYELEHSVYSDTTYRTLALFCTFTTQSPHPVPKPPRTTNHELRTAKHERESTNRE